MYEHSTMQSRHGYTEQCVAADAAKSAGRNGRSAPGIERSAAAFAAAVNRHLKYSLGKEAANATRHDYFRALSLTTRDYMIDAYLETEQRYARTDGRWVYYLSMEYLVGRSLSNNLYNLGLHDTCMAAVKKLGVDFDEIVECESDAALGNGGLGRLAACFLDSLATLDLPATGYGINYEFGLFRQIIDNGGQKERPDQWLREKSPWLLERADERYLIPIYGRIEHFKDMQSNYNPMWLDWKVIVGAPHDMLIAGYGGKTVNALRLFSAVPSDEFDMGIFNKGDYYRAVEQKILSETVSKVLYPSDEIPAGKELRLVQEYFLVACAIRDINRKFRQSGASLRQFAEKCAIQMNDTHPALCVAEVMRLLIDENDLSWETAWEITQQSLAFTNHTLLPEALEKWPVSLLEKVLPRHLQIIFEINQRFLQQVAVRWPGDFGRLGRLSIIEEGAVKQVRMAHLAITGSHSINGVARLHSELIKTQLVPDFYEMWPERFNNKTNGITPRRWLLKANPALAELISRTIGTGWITELEKLRELERYAADPAFQREFMAIKAENKRRLAHIMQKLAHTTVDEKSMFDIQCKRIHEYKRQLLNVLHIIYRYLLIVEDDEFPRVAKTYIFAGKAAPGYFMAKLIIKLINNVAAVVNQDKRASEWMRVVFLPDYRVSLAERIIPAANLSEQISTAGKEASGTGNMKFALNGALTIGTLDGANIEIAEEVGEENLYIFGLTADEIAGMRQQRRYDPREYYRKSMPIKRVMDSLGSDYFCKYEPGLFRPIYSSLLEQGDAYFLLADFAAYIRAHDAAMQDYLDPFVWAQKSILNTARMGKFSSDRTIREYAEQIWHIESIRRNL